ncbi:MAG: thermopsin family protease [Nitrososphaeria archaeon]
MRGHLLAALPALLALALLLQAGGAAPSAHALPAAPARGSPDPSGSISLSPRQYAWQPVQALTGMSVTFRVSSTVPVDVYLMTPSQLSGFEATGSAQYIYHSSGTYVSSSVGPLAGGTYYLVIYNDLSSGTASVNYTASTVPVNVYYYRSSLPAPIGVADYGVLNATGALHPYEIVYGEALGTAVIYSIGAYNSSPPPGVSPYGASLQLNAVLQVNTTHGDYAYWLQDVACFLTNNDTMFLNDNIWNMTSPASHLTNASVAGSGAVHASGSGYFYGYGTAPRPYALPLTLHLAIAYARTADGVDVGFGYGIGGSAGVAWYDNATIREPGITSVGLVVDGYSYTPSGDFYDAELVFGGEGNGEATHFTSMNATLILRYALPNGSIVSPPAIYGFGSDTAEAADDLSTSLVNGYPVVTIGSGNFGPVGYSSSVPAFSASISLSAPAATDAGLGIPVSISSSVSNGVAPYTYYVLVDGAPAYNLTTYGQRLSASFDLPPLPAGLHSLQVEVVDAVGSSAWSARCWIRVNPAPSASLRAARNATDVGVPVALSASVSGGTPPYTYTWYVDGVQVYRGSSSYSYDPGTPGPHAVSVSITDSAGLTVNASVEVMVNPDPAVSASANASATDVGLGVALSSSVEGGTPPYSYAWYVDGRLACASPSCAFSPGSPGAYSAYAVVTDSAGYTVKSPIINVTVNPDPTVSVSISLSSSSALYEDDVARMSASVSGGTPPYTYTWYVDGDPVAVTASPSCTCRLPPGSHSLSVRVVDSAGYAVIGGPVHVTASYDYPLIGAVAASAAIAALAAAALRRRAASDRVRPPHPGDPSG